MFPNFLKNFVKVNNDHLKKDDRILIIGGTRGNWRNNVTGSFNFFNLK